MAQTLDSPTTAAKLDAESAGWVARLRAGSPTREAAIKDLHVLLLKAARFELRRRHAMLGPALAGEQEDLAQQSADDALIAILGKLDVFRGDSRFTTWAYKFALLEAAVKARRRAWHDREVQLESDDWARIADRMHGPDDDAQTSELMGTLSRAIKQQLTPRQRTVLVAVTLDDVPIDVLAERMQTTRGVLYKTLHDARRKLRAALAQEGLEIDPLSERGRS
ncbi:MAG TPA: sigma-70 family RNA polymerase sigma factor [Solirubrobacteraceae bacterium]|jgi:RNA polymerase sigma-70 factor (ECF subfamily)